MDKKKPNSITRAIIDSTVERSLREIEEDPKRSVRKLTDMGRLFNSGRFMDEVYGMVQDLLRNDDSPYYTVANNILRNSAHKNLRDFGISFGYCGLTFGGRTIREREATHDYRIPCVLGMRVDPTLKNSLSVTEIAACVSEGTREGIYIYCLRIRHSLSCMKDLAEVMKSQPDCAFLLLMPDLPLSEEQVADMTRCTNVLYLFDAAGRFSRDNQKALKSRRALAGIYAFYNDETAKDWVSGALMGTLLPYHAPINILVSEDSTSKENGEMVAAYCRAQRRNPEYPLILFDLVGDSIQISHTATAEDIYLEILENGDLRTCEGLLSDFRHTVSLKQLLTVALPKE